MSAPRVCFVFICLMFTVSAEYEVKKCNGQPIDATCDMGKVINVTKIRAHWSDDRSEICQRGTNCTRDLTSIASSRNYYGRVFGACHMKPSCEGITSESQQINCSTGSSGVVRSSTYISLHYECIDHLGSTYGTPSTTEGQHTVPTRPSALTSTGEEWNSSMKPTQTDQKNTDQLLPVVVTLPVVIVCVVSGLVLAICLVKRKRLPKKSHDPEQSGDIHPNNNMVSHLEKRRNPPNLDLSVYTLARDPEITSQHNDIKDRSSRTATGDIYTEVSDVAEHNTYSDISTDIAGDYDLCGHNASSLAAPTTHVYHDVADAAGVHCGTAIEVDDTVLCDNECYRTRDVGNPDGDVTVLCDNECYRTRDVGDPDGDVTVLCDNECYYTRTNES